MANEATKPSMQMEWHYIVVDQNATEHTLEYVGVEKQVADFIIFVIQNSWLASMH